MPRDLEHKKKYDKEYREIKVKEDPEFHRRKDLWKLYKIRIEDFDKMYKEQDGKCKLCNDNIPYRGRQIAVDHDHKTGIVRGILCKHCNVGIGHFEESIEKLQKAIEYLTISIPIDELK